jgi:hypothetical protein
MAVKRTEYKGMLIKAGAFELVGTGCFLATLLIRRSGPAHRRNAKLFDLPSSRSLFEDPDAAIDCTVAYARAIIDGEIPGQTVEDL